MKTIFTIISLLAFTLCMTACRDNGTKTDGVAPPAETAQVTPEPAATEAVPASPSPDGAEQPAPGPEAKPEPPHYDFRKATWGMSMEEVLQSEHDEPETRDENSLVYKGAILSEPVRISFEFNDNKLVRGGIVFTEKMKDNSKYIEVYEKAKEVLTNTDGPPEIDAEKQINPDAVIDPDHVADAICRGDMIYGAQWTRQDGTVVRLVLNGQDSKCRLVVIYHSPGNVRFRADQNGSGQ